MTVLSLQKMICWTGSKQRGQSADAGEACEPSEEEVPPPVFEQRRPAAESGPRRTGEPWRGMPMKPGRRIMGN